MGVEDSMRQEHFLCYVLQLSVAAPARELDHAHAHLVHVHGSRPKPRGKAQEERGEPQLILRKVGDSSLETDGLAGFVTLLFAGTTTGGYC